jgi:sarcosine oxidase subunit alpha
MFRRSRACKDPVTIHLDGEPLVAERGEPLAATLLAADKTILARSPKLHRPRGPTCFRGGCDGCLARVDGVPNVMLCQTEARGGERIEAQNVIGSRKADLLRVTDWFFPKGIDHHHMLAGVPGLSTVMQNVAEKVAGMGRLPSTGEPAHPARRLAVDVAVVGAGPTGLAAASALLAAGLEVALIDDGLALGGALSALPERAAELASRHAVGGAQILSRSVAAGYYDGELLVVTPAVEAWLVRPRATLFATGAHDGVLAVPGNDLPGVFSARALCRVVHAGIEPDGPTVIVGSGFWADELSRALGGDGAAAVLRVDPADLVEVRGTGGVRTITVREAGALVQHRVAVVAVARPGAPSFELAAQAGAAQRFDPQLGFVVVTDASGRAAEGVFAAGECAGMAFEPEALVAEGRRVAAAISTALR